MFRSGVEADGAAREIQAQDLRPERLGTHLEVPPSSSSPTTTSSSPLSSPLSSFFCALHHILFLHHLVYLLSFLFLSSNCASDRARLSLQHLFLFPYVLLPRMDTSFRLVWKFERRLTELIGASTDDDKDNRPLGLSSAFLLSPPLPPNFFAFPLF